MPTANGPKPGYKTTEFWLTVLANLPAIATMVLGQDNKVALSIGAATTAIYTIARMFVKNAAVPAA